MKLELSRRDVCSLMIGCTLIHRILFDDDPTWTGLHDKLKRQLEEYDHQRLKEGDPGVR